MRKLLKILLILTFSLAAIYSVAWYSWGLMLRHSLVTIMQSSQLEKYVSFDGLELQGFPSTLQYRFINLKLTKKYAEGEVIINLGNPVVSSDFLMKDFVVYINDDIAINSEANKQSFLLKYNDGAVLNLATTNSLILNIFNQNHFNDFTIADLESINYRDYGYRVEDLILDKSIFMSKGSDVGLIKKGDKTKDIYIVQAIIHGEGSVDYSKALLSLLDIKLDSKLELTYKDEQKKSLENIYFVCEQCMWSSNDYKMNLLGSLSLENATQSSEGELNFSIIGYNNFANMLDVYMNEERNEQINSLVSKITGVSDPSSLTDVHIQIKGDGHNIKIGNANIIDLMLYYMKM